MKRYMTDTEIEKLEKVSEITKSKLPNGYRVEAVENDLYETLNPKIRIITLSNNIYETEIRIEKLNNSSSSQLATIIAKFAQSNPKTKSNIFRFSI